MELASKHKGLNVRISFSWESEPGNNGHLELQATICGVGKAAERRGSGQGSVAE
jgi:hypothetical protein